MTELAAATAFHSMQRRRRRRWLGVIAVVVMAIVDLVGAFLPLTPSETAQIDRTLGPSVPASARVALALFGAGVLVVVRGIRLGHRRVWVAAMLVGGLSAAAQVFRDGTAASAAVCLAATAVLALDGASYRVPGRGPGVRWLLAPVAIALVMFGALGVVEHADGLPHLSYLGRAGVVVRGLLFLRQTVAPTTTAARAFLASLRLAGAVLALGVIATLASVVRPSRRDLRVRNDDVRFFAEHGRSSVTPLAALPGNHIVRLTADTRVGGRLAGGAMVAVGPPTNRRGNDARALGAFVDQCEQWGVIPAVIGADEREATLGRRLGFSALKIGEEAFIDLEEFSTAGSARANVRHYSTRAERDGLTVIHYDAASRTRALDDDLRRINASWLANKRGPELGFTLGRFDPAKLDLCEMYVVVDASGSAVAFTTWLPYGGGTGAVLDLMRRGERASQGTMELLITRALGGLRERGFTTASLGGVPLASTTAPGGRLQRAMRWFYENAGPVYEAKGLFAFKRKFDPRWEPMYLLYPAGADLARVAVAIGRAFLPGRSVGSRLRAYTIGRRTSGPQRVAGNGALVLTRQRSQRRTASR